MLNGSGHPVYVGDGKIGSTAQRRDPAAWTPPSPGRNRSTVVFFSRQHRRFHIIIVASKEQAMQRIVLAFALLVSAAPALAQYHSGYGLLGSGYVKRPAIGGGT